MFILIKLNNIAHIIQILIHLRKSFIISPLIHPACKKKNIPINTYGLI